MYIVTFVMKKTRHLFVVISFKLDYFLPRQWYSIFLNSYCVYRRFNFLGFSRDRKLKKKGEEKAFRILMN